MQRGWALAAPIAFSLLAVAACAPKQAAPTSGTSRPPKRATPPQRPPVAAPTPSAYVAIAGSIDLLLIRASELALQRSSSLRVREFAAIDLQAHKDSGAQLSLASRRLNLLPSAILQSKHQAMLEQLVTATNFDAAYKQLQLSAHAEALALNRTFASNGQSPTLRPVASAALPGLERHMRLLRYL